jgi:hypothetical protein
MKHTRLSIAACGGAAGWTLRESVAEPDASS